MKTKKIALAAFLMCMAYHCSANLPANAGYVVNITGGTFSNGFNLGAIARVVAASGNTIDIQNGDINANEVGSDANGTLKVEKGNVTAIASFINNGISGINGSLTSSGKFSNSGEMSVGSLNTNGSSNENKNSGNLTINGTAESNLQNKFENSGLLNNNKQPKGKLNALKTKDFTNSGTVNNNGKIESSGTFTNEESGTLNNNNKFFNGKNKEESSNAKFENKGTINNSGASEDIDECKFVNNGEMTNDKTGTINNTDGAEFNNNKTMTNKGTFNNYSTTTSATGTFNNNKGATMTNDGIFNNDGSGYIDNKGTFTNNNIINNDGGSITNEKAKDNGGKFTNNGVIKNTNFGDIDNESEFTNGINGSITLDTGSKFTNSKDATFGNYGLLESTDAVDPITKNITKVINNGTFDNYGVFNSKGNFSNSGQGSQFKNHMIFNNDGKMTNGAKGTITNGGLFSNNGSLDNKGALTNNSNGRLTNNGTAVNEGNLTNEGGLVNNGDFDNTGNFTNTDGIVFNNANMTNKGIVDGGDWENNGNLVNDNFFLLGKTDKFNNTGNFVNDSMFRGGDITNEGTLTNNYFMSDSKIDNKGTLNNVGKIITDEITNEVGGVLNNTGSITKGTSVPGLEQPVELENKGLVNNSGSMDVKQTEGSTGTIVNEKQGSIKGEIAGGTLENEGTISGDLTVGKQGTLHLGAGTTFADGAKVATSGFLDSRNGNLEDLSKNTTLSSGAKIAPDISSATGKTDIFGTAEGDIILEDFNPVADTLLSRGSITTEELKKSLGLGEGATLSLGKEAQQDHIFLTPLRYLNAKADGSGISFAPTGSGYRDFNPAVMASPVAAQIGGYLNQLNSYDEAFRNMDMYMLMTKKQRKALKLRNKYAAADSNLVFDPTNTPYDDKAAWFRPYATFENVSLKGGPKVSNVAYGTYFGAESELKELGHGWDGMYGVYAGYNGSHQAYDGIGIYQNGGTLGLVGMAYKGNFFTGLTVNAGANVGEAHTYYGQDNFTMMLAGVANKTGYNWELAEGKFIIQPSLMTSYSFVNTFDYTNSAGISIDSDAMHVVTFEPGLKFIGNLKNGWQPYAGVSFVWNLLDKTQFQANDASLPELSIKPFVRYGIGVRKTWGERLTGFFQTFFTNGGRNGVGFQLGFRMTLGKNGKAIKKGHTPELPKTVLKLGNR